MINVLSTISLLSSRLPDPHLLFHVPNALAPPGSVEEVPRDGASVVASPQWSNDFVIYHLNIFTFNCVINNDLQK